MPSKAHSGVRLENLAADPRKEFEGPSLSLLTSSLLDLDNTWR